jgi:hypothetical protein
VKRGCPTIHAVFNANAGTALEVVGGVVGFAVDDCVVSNGKHAEEVSAPVPHWLSGAEGNARKSKGMT